MTRLCGTCSGHGWVDDDVCPDCNGDGIITMGHRSGDDEE